VQTGKLQNPDVQRQLSVSDIPGKPMSLGELAALMKGESREAEPGGEDRRNGAAMT
jgi:hypothetical protein